MVTCIKKLEIVLNEVSIDNCVVAAFVRKTPQPRALPRKNVKTYVIYMSKNNIVVINLLWV